MINFRINIDPFGNKFDVDGPFTCHSLKKSGIPVETNQDLKCVARIQFTYFRFILNESVDKRGDTFL